MVGGECGCVGVNANSASVCWTYGVPITMGEQMPGFEKMGVVLRLELLTSCRVAGVDGE